MRALLDEQLSPQIAVLLRKGGYDVDAVAERDDLAGRSDRVVFEAACSEGHAVVTNNIKDFRPLAAEYLAQGRVHSGLVLLPSARTRSRARSLPSPRPSRGFSVTILTALARASAGSAR